MLKQTVPNAIKKLLPVPSGLCDTYDGDIERSSPDHLVQGWEDFLVCQVSGGAKEDQGIRQSRLRQCFDAGLCSRENGLRHGALRVSFPLGALSFHSSSSSDYQVKRLRLSI
jgi:hypothetical protein